MSILVVGNAVVDIAYRIRRLPRPGETVLASARTMDVGGKGLNQAIAARRAGAEVRLMTPVGRDEPARRIRDVLVRESLDPSLLVAVDASTDGARIVVNTAPWVPGAELLVPMANVLVVNAGEAIGLSGATVPEAAAEALVGRGPECVVVTLGAAGAHLLIGDTHYRLPAPAATAVDTTGAGDVLVGVLTAALDAGSDLRAATVWAIRAASLKVKRPGTIVGFPTATEVAAARPT